MSLLIDDDRGKRYNSYIYYESSDGKCLRKSIIIKINVI